MGRTINYVNQIHYAIVGKSDDMIAWGPVPEKFLADAKLTWGRWSTLNKDIRLVKIEIKEIEDISYDVESQGGSHETNL